MTSSAPAAAAKGPIQLEPPPSYRRNDFEGAALAVEPGLLAVVAIGGGVNVPVALLVEVEVVVIVDEVEVVVCLTGASGSPSRVIFKV